MSPRMILGASTSASPEMPMDESAGPPGPQPTDGSASSAPDPAETRASKPVQAGPVADPAGRQGEGNGSWPRGADPDGARADGTRVDGATSAGGGPDGAWAEGAAAASLPEAALVQRARAGDAGAFEDLMKAHLQRVWRVVWRVLRHREDTEDVVQEVFLTAFRSLPDYRGDASFSTWLHRIAVTRALNHVDRSAEKIRRSSEPLETEDARGSSLEARASVGSPMGTPPESPLQALEAEDLRRRLARCLDRLPEAWRAVLALRDGEELAYEEIASSLRINLGTVRSRLARGRIALRQCIEGQSP